VIASCAGSNKKDAKAASAKRALFIAAPSVYKGMFGDDSPPEGAENLLSTQEVAPAIADENICLGDTK
jgi:hypothetical protein